MSAMERQVGRGEVERMGKAKAAGVRRAALGELTNCPAAAIHTKKMGPVKPSAKPLAVPEARPTFVDQPVPFVVQTQVPAGPPPSVQEPDVVSIKEEALCQAFSEALLSVQDVDKEDGDEPYLCSEYVKHIYAYLRDLEVQQAVQPNYMQGYEIDGRMRALLVDWLVQVHSRFQLLPETLYLTVAILDRFLQVQPVSRRKLQLVGVTAMLVASKYEEMYCPEVGDFAYITDNAFTRSQILEMEQIVLRSLKFDLGRPLPLHFLRRASKVANSDVEKHTLAKYLMELTLIDYDMVHYRPSEVAAASLFLSQLLLEELPWSATQEHYSTYDEAHLKPIVQHIAKNVLSVTEGKTKFQAVRKKYTNSKLMKISLLPQLKSSLIKDLAAAAVDKL